MAREKLDFGKFSDEEIRKIKLDVEKEMKAKRKEVIDRVVRVMGLLASVYIYVLIFSSTTGLTFFGYFYAGRPGYETPENLWLPVLQTADIYKFLMGGAYPGLAIILLSFVQIGLGATLGILIATYIKDTIGVVRSFFGIGKSIVKNAAEGVREGVSEDNPGGKKSLFGFTKLDSKEAVKKEKTKKEPKPMVEKPVDPINKLTPEQAELVLSGKARISDFVKEEQPVVSIVPQTTVATQEIRSESSNESQSVLQQRTAKKSLFDK
jgi:hypothetical protein